MEKPCKLKSKILAFLPKAASPVKSKILAFLPKAASPVTFQLSPPVSPAVKPAAGKGYPGPIISIIPKEARRKPKNGSFDTREPTSPKVSCMGQVMNKKKNRSKPKHVLLPQQATKQVSSPKEVKINKKPLAVMEIFKETKQGRKSDVSNSDKKPPVAERVPSLNQMTRFASGRGALSDFDWKAQDAAVAPNWVNNDLYDEKEGYSKEEERMIIPSSTPIIVGGEEDGVESRKEVNLWKRRTMAPPRTLQF